MSTDENILAGGPLQDERLRFYLRHRQQIEDWVPLGKEVRLATVEVFQALQPEIEQLAASLGDDVHFEYGVYRNTWTRIPFARIRGPPLNGIGWLSNLNAQLIVSIPPQAMLPTSG